MKLEAEKLLDMVSLIKIICYFIEFYMVFPFFLNFVLNLILIQNKTHIYQPHSFNI